MTETVKPQKPTILRRVGILAGTLATIVLAIALVAAGSDVIAERAKEAPQVSERRAVSVATQPLLLVDSYEVEATYRGRIEAGRRLDLGFETGGTLAEILVEEGDRVTMGQRLATLDTAILAAQRAAEVAARDALAAQVELARRTAERQRELKARDFASGQRLDEAELALARLRAELQRAEAAIAAKDVALEKSVILAPFDAVIGARLVDDGARIGAGQALFTLFEAATPQFRVGVPTHEAETLAPGLEMSVRLGSDDLPATLQRVRGDIAAATRTQDLIFDLPAGTVAAEGALGTLTLARTVEGQGAWVPSTALSEGIKGLWTIFIVKDGVAYREAVELVHSDGGRAFIRGHFSGTESVVTTGPHRIANGQPVLAAGS